jgi:hypothetical protein
MRWIPKDALHVRRGEFSAKLFALLLSAPIHRIGKARHPQSPNLAHHLAMDPTEAPAPDQPGFQFFTRQRYRPVQRVFRTVTG